MSRAIPTVLVMAFAVLGAEPAACQSPEDEGVADSVLVLTGQLGRAWERLDAEEYLGWFAQDLSFYIAGQRVERADFDRVVRGTTRALRSSTFEILDPRVRVLSPGNAAVSFGLRELMIDTVGDTTDFRGAMTLLWSLSEEGWKVVVAHESIARGN